MDDADNRREEEREEEDERESSRPRVVDKRISARAEQAEEAPAEEAPAEEPPPAAPPPPSAQPPPADAEGDVWTPEREAEARRVAEEIGRIPARDWTINTAVTLMEVAGVKLNSGQLEEASLAIDALRGLLDSVGGRLDEAEKPLRQNLAQLQLAYANAAGSR